MHRPTLRHLRFALAFALFGIAIPSVGSAVPVETGYRDHSFGGSLVYSPTAEKPESKIWFNDGFWWGCLWDTGASSYRIHRLDTDTQNWLSTGPDADDRTTTLADAKSDGTLLYIVSHPYDGSSGSSRLYSYDYDSGSFGNRDSGLDREVACTIFRMCHGS